MSRRLLHPLAYAVYLLLAIGMTYPLITQMGSVFIGAPESDAYEYARHIWWYTHALRHGDPVFYHTTLAHPDGLPALWLWAIPLQSFPAVLFSLVMPLPTAYNLMVLLRLALNGWAAFFLVRRLLDGTHTGDRITPYPVPAALVAGAIFMLYPAVQGQLFGSHAGIVALWGAPLYVDALYRLRRHNTWRDYLLAAVFFVACILGSNLLLVFVVLPITGYFIVMRLLAREWVWLRRVIIAGAAGMLLAAVFFVPAAYEQATSDTAVDPGGAVRFSADVLALVTPSFFHPLYGGLSYPRAVLGTNIVEGTGYVGVLAALIALVGVWRVRTARAWMVLAAIMWIVSLGPLLKFMDDPVTVEFDGRVSYVPLPFALFQYLPVLGTVRTPARANLTIGLAVAIMAGYGLGWALRWRGWRFVPLRYALAAVLIALIALDYQVTWHGNLPYHPTVTAHIPAEVQALRSAENAQAVFNVPHDNLLVAKEAMYLQTGHQRPLIAGFISRQTPVNPAKLNVLQNSLDAALLHDADATHVILFRGWSDDLNTHVYNRLGTPVYEDERLAAFQVPTPDAPPAFHSYVDVPDAIEQRGDIYFHAPAPLWVPVDMTLQAERERALTLLLDDVPIQRLVLPEGEQTAVQIPIYLPGGYHTLTLLPDPPCPQHTPHPALRCEQLIASDIAVGEPAAPSLDTAVQFERGITLQSAHVNEEGSVWLWWNYADGTTEDMVRFVQLIGEDSTQIAGDDTPPGVVAAGEQRTDTLQLTLPDDLPPGTYRVFTGWYTLPDVARLDVQTDVPGAVNDWVQIGELVLP